MAASMQKQIESIHQQIKAFSALYHTAAADSGISDNEFWVWYALLVMGGEYSQQDICQLWSLPKQTVNSTIANLIQKELVVLKAAQGTRNRKIICPTEAGKTYGESIVKPVAKAEQHAMNHMTEFEREAFIALTTKFIQSLRSELEERKETETK